jgi:sugar lactone lactonase YvrE
MDMGCTKPSHTLKREGAPSLVWPPPPEVARIQYLYSISKPEDLGIAPSLFKKVVRVLTGKKVAQYIVRPSGIFVTREDMLYVADPGMRRVHAFNLQDHRYDQIEKFGKEHFVSPIDVAVDHQDNLYISDSILRKVFVFNGKGNPEREIGGADRLSRPAGIAIHPVLKRLYVVDSNAHVIQVFDLLGNFLFSIGSRGAEPGAFNFPTFMCIDQSGLLYVTDSLNFRVQVFKPDGEFLYLFGKQGDGVGEFSHPKGIALDRVGNIYVTDAIFDAIQVFDKAGTLLLYLGEAGQEPGQFWIPNALYIDHTNRIFVSDSYNQRVQIFRFLGGGER